MADRFVPLVVASADGIEDYPISRAERLDSHAFMKWWFHRWMASRTFKLASWEAQGMAVALFSLCQVESPVGTLPDDDAELAVMLRIDTRRVADLRRQEFGPFRGWRRCRSDGEIRLMHPVVLEQVRDALDRREMRELSKDDQAERKRIERIRVALKERGFSDITRSDPVLLGRMNEWLSANWKGNRTAEAYDLAVSAARKAGWVERKLS